MADIVDCLRAMDDDGVNHAGSAALEIERLRNAAAAAASWLENDWVDVHAPHGLRVALRKLRHIAPNAVCTPSGVQLREKHTTD